MVTFSDILGTICFVLIQGATEQLELKMFMLYFYLFRLNKPSALRHRQMGADDAKVECYFIS